MAAQQPGDKLWHPSWVAAAGEATIARRQQATTSVRLFCSWFCPYAQRAWIALEEKGVDYTYVEINPYEVHPDAPGGYSKKQLPLKVKSKTYPGFVEASPKGLVPALDNDGESVWESLQLVEYINEAFAGPRLMPDSAHARAMVRIWIAHCDSKIQKNFYLMLMEQDAEEQAKAKQALLDGCRALARAMAPSGFFLGDTFSEFEIAIAPFWQRYLWVGEHYRGFKFPDNDADFDRLAEWWLRTTAHPSVAATQVCKPRLISSYSQYSTNAGTSDYAKSLQRNIRSRAGVSASGSGAVPFFVGMGLGVAATAAVLNKLR